MTPTMPTIPSIPLMPPMTLPSTRVLFQSACVIVSMTSDHLHIKALDAPIDDKTIETILGNTDVLLSQPNGFKTTWDLRHCHAPSLGQATRCLRWALNNKRTLDQKNTRLAILHDGKSQIIQKTVSFVLKAFGPRCPMWIGSSEEEANNFMKEETVSKV